MQWRYAMPLFSLSLMKKTLLFLLLGLASTTAAFAQARPGGSMTSKDYTGGKTTESGNTGFGVKAGYNFSRPYGDGVSNASSYNGFAADTSPPGAQPTVSTIKVSADPCSNSRRVGSSQRRRSFRS